MSSNPAQNATVNAGPPTSPPGGHYLPIGEAANFLGVSIGILRKFEETGKIVPLKTLSGERRYSFAALQKIAEEVARGGATGGSPVEYPQSRLGGTRTSDGTRERQDPESPQTLSSVLKELEVEPQEKTQAPKPKKASLIRDYVAEGINPYQTTGLLSVEQAASKMGVSSRTIRRLIAKGKLRPATTGKYGSILIPATHVDALVNGFQKASDSTIALPALAPSTQEVQLSARRLFFLNAAFVFVWLAVLGSSIFLGYTLAPEAVKEGVKGQIAGLLFGEGDLASPTPSISSLQNEQTKQALISDYLKVKDGNRVDYKVFFAEGIEVGTNTLTIDDKGKLTTSEPITITDTSVSSLRIGGGLVAGTGNVYIIDRSGRIPALTSTYIADLDATSLTGKIDNADHLDGIDSSSFLRSNESDTAEGAINFTAKPGSTGVGGGAVYVNPGGATSNYTLFGVALNASSRFRVDAEGDTVIAGDVQVAGGDLTTDATTFNLVNTTATTVNFAGAGTTVGIGASTGTTTINNNLVVSGTATLSANTAVLSSGQLTLTRNPTQPHTGTWAIGSSTWNASDATIYANPASPTADSNIFALSKNGDVQFAVDAEGDIYGNNLILAGSTTTGTTTVTGSLSVEGNTTLGDATTDTWTVNPATLTWAGGNKTLDLTGAATRTLTLLNSTASQVANLDLSDGSLNIASTTALDNSRNATLGSVTATGLVQTTLITEQLRLRYDASNYLSATVGSTGAVTLDATGSGAAFTISDALTASSTLTVSGASITASSASLAIGGALSGATTVTGSGNINTTGGALQTNSVTRIDNAGAGTLASLTLTTDLAVADGGTGASTFTDAGVLIGNTTGAIQVTSAGTSGQVLTSNGAGVDPTFAAAPSGVPTAFTAALILGF